MIFQGFPKIMTPTLSLNVGSFKKGFCLMYQHLEFRVFKIDIIIGKRHYPTLHFKISPVA